MKNNLMQSHGLAKGTRYNQAMATAVLSEENFDTLLLSANGEKKASHEEGLEQALEDHLNSLANAQNKREDDNDKYYLRIKEANKNS